MFRLKLTLFHIASILSHCSSIFAIAEEHRFNGGREYPQEINVVTVMFGEDGLGGALGLWFGDAGTVFVELGGGGGGSNSEGWREGMIEEEGEREWPALLEEEEGLE
ncbi:hypothetical protein RJT34_17325 [Clitoria ternatea]|uniref:Uncharacterized protein n=1 Tax=Clitoria ternatea TaxID=43366 RepID=A0AAN9JAE2_CLITE